MIGAIFGDIAGSKYEFNNIKTKDFELITDDCYFTDDSVCTIAFMDWLNHAKERNEKTATEYLHKWTRRYPNAGYGGRFWHWVHSDNPKPYNSFGNGSAMRVSAVAWHAKNIEDLRYLSDTVTKITHNHPEGMKGALVTATCIYMALHGSAKEEIKEYAVSQYPEIANLDYEELRRTYVHAEEICQNTVPQAIYCFLISNDFHDCAKTTISIGGDCDTTAAISCAIAEAFYGVSKHDYELVISHLPSDMRKVVEESKIYSKIDD